MTNFRSDTETLSTIENDIYSNIFVEAGAGTGKTYSLVKRITALLSSGVSIDQIIAITFTRAAASELRSRIRDELGKLHLKNPKDEHITKALEGIDTAAFQTIDSLVYSILQDYPLEAGLPPAIDVQDAPAQLRVFREEWRQWAIEKLGQKDEGFATTISSALRLELKFPFERVSELARAMNDQHGELQRAKFPDPSRIGVQTIKELEDQIDNLAGLMKLCNNVEDNLYVNMVQVVEWYKSDTRFTTCTDEFEAESLLMTWPKVTASGGSFKNYRLLPTGSRTRDATADLDGKAAIQAARNGLKQIIDSIDGALKSAREAVTLELFGYAREFVRQIIEERRNLGNLSYYDAITWLIEMLRSRDDIRRALQRRFRHILVDEFQDTDPSQVELVRQLTIPPNADTIAPGSLFVVGDPKQSIYKFRGAQVEVSQGVKSDIENDEAGGKYLTLRENRRSARRIIDWVNHVFGKWMSDEEGQAEWIALDMAEETEAPETIGKVFHFGEPVNEIKLSEVRKLEACEVAKIARAVCAGALKVRDRRDQKERRSRPGDLTILTRARTDWENYFVEFDALKLPYTAEIGGAAVFSTQEFRDLLNCLHAIDDPSDQPSTVGALKSPYFGCSDADLYEWTQAGGSFSCTAEFPPDIDDSSAAQAMVILRSYNVLRDELQPSVLIDQFIRERKGRELMFLTADPTAGLRRLDLAVELARQFTEEGAASLRECLNRFSEFKESDATMREEPSLEFDQGKIRFMSMHASKGLEFPIVILADLSRGEGNSTSQMLVEQEPKSDAESNVGIRLGGSKPSGYFETRNYEELLKSDMASDALEKTRLHYVAATRARDYLFVSKYRNTPKSGKDTTSAGIIDRYAGNDEAIWSAVPEGWYRLSFTPESSHSNTETNFSHRDREAWTAEHQKVHEAASGRSWLSPSSFKESKSDFQPDIDAEKPDFVPVSDEDTPISLGRAATRVGSAVHAAIQRSLELPHKDVSMIARIEAEKHGVQESCEEVERLTLATLNMPLLKHVADPNRNDIWIETPVAVPISDGNGSTIVIDGRVDLIYRCDDGTLGIADFKTDRSFNRLIDDMGRQYIPQLGAYAHAVETATGIRVSQASILFSRLAAERHGEGEYRLPDVQSAVELALKLASKQ